MPFSGLLILAGFLTHGLLVGWSAAIGGHDTALPLLPRGLYLAGVLSGSCFILPKAQESPAMHAQLEELSGAGTSVVVLGREDHVCGWSRSRSAAMPPLGGDRRRHRGLAPGRFQRSAPAWRGHR